MKNTAKFKNKYRIESARLPGWDYSREGAYFVTIDTKDRACLFGEVINNAMILNEIGKIVADEWKKSEHMRDEIFLDEFIVMPNHLHGIIQIDYSRCDDAQPHRNDVRFPGRDARLCVSTGPDTQNNTGIAYRPPKSISSFIAGFKSSSTRKINAMRGKPGMPVWQARFYDHIIRDERSYYNIQQYIQNNPANWRNDEFYDPV